MGEIPSGIVVFVVPAILFSGFLWVAVRVTRKVVFQQFMDGHTEEGMPKVREHSSHNEHGPFC